MGLGIAFARSFIELLIFYAIYLVAVTYF